jgi:serine/threonine-protein kinase RsbW
MTDAAVPARIGTTLGMAPPSTKAVGRKRRRPVKGETRMLMANRRDAVGPTVDRILAAVAVAGFDSDQKLDLAVALSEALSNAVVHGNRQHPRSRVAITVTVVPRKRAVIEVKDAGNGFDHASLRDPTDSAQLLEPRGRGVFLMKRLVDRVEFLPPGNRVRLTVGRRG